MPFQSFLPCVCPHSHANIHICWLFVDWGGTIHHVSKHQEWDIGGGLYISILSVINEGYSRNGSCALRLIYTFLFGTEIIWHANMVG